MFAVSSPAASSSSNSRDGKPIEQSGGPTDGPKNVTTVDTTMTPKSLDEKPTNDRRAPWSAIERAWPWVLRGAWAALALMLPPMLSAAMENRSMPVRVVVAIGAWLVWGLGLLATLVPHPIGLVGLRCVTPLLVAASVWALLPKNVPNLNGIIPSQSGLSLGVKNALGIASALIICIVLLYNETGHLCINGPAYPNERRFLLRPAAPVFLVAAPLSGALVCLAVVSAPLLLAAKNFIGGTVALLAAVPILWVLPRSLYALAKRFVVFVPAGFVLHDNAALREPVLFRRQQVERIHAAPADTDSLDLTLNAPGLALEFLLTEKVEIARLMGPRDRVGETGKTARFLAVPTLPGRLLHEAATRRYRTV
jgi:hypothetical protein